MEIGSGGVSVGGVEWAELRALIAGRGPLAVIERLRDVPPEELRALRAPLEALRRELRADRESSRSQLPALQVAGVLAAGTPREALRWLTDRDQLELFRPAAFGDQSPGTRERVLLTLLFLPHRDLEWQRELAVRLTEWLPAGRGQDVWDLAEGLAVRAGADIPVTEGYLTGWVRRGSRRYLSTSWEWDVHEWLGEQGLGPAVQPFGSLLEWLRTRPRLAELVPRLFDFDGLGALLAEPYAHHRGEDNEWPKALVVLTREGRLDRADLLDRTLARLLRGDRPGALKAFTMIYDGLAPTLEETAARVRMYASIAADGAGPAATRAHKALKALDAAGRLDGDVFADLCGAVLARTEKTLVTDQLKLLDKALRRDPARFGPLLATVALALGHPAVTVQERALRVAARHLGGADAAVRDELRAAAETVDAALQGDARTVFGSPAAPEPPSASPLTAPARAMPPELDTPVRLAAGIAALVDGALTDPLEFERVLQAAVALTWYERAATAEALEPLASRRIAEKTEHLSYSHLRRALGCLIETLAGRPRPHWSGARDFLATGTEHGHHCLDLVPIRRVYELTSRLATDPVPCLLAFPTDPDGLIHPDALRRRLTAYATAGAAPWPDDLEQAFLRLPAGTPAGTVAALREAAGLPGTGPGLPVLAKLRLRRHTEHEAALVNADRRVAGAHLVPVFARRDEPEEGSLAATLADLPDPDALFRFRNHGREGGLLGVLWPLVAPAHPDLVAAHAIPRLSMDAGRETGRRANTLLPYLAEYTTGPCGPVTHLALAYGLTAAPAGNRAAAVEALLTLAAHGRLDAERLGELLGRLWLEGVGIPTRFLPALGDAARAGAAHETWTVAVRLLDELEPYPATRGLPAVLTLAAECAALTGGGDEPPVLAQLAALTEPPRVAAEARRLRRVLARI
ncbi:hypothetical protein SRB5_12770 [Streptomyces sp. RB5]|uniref:Secreted protein n=1 Tax=Streptomyces smaragdinus TaxID=2585196 RepID=A0A7K0CCT4_9ACTN|nr:DUF6493 family protein [Streptomyces smaragdinus]MQY11163.1 hypothetical protein [Streptomyces smaragdinus]